MNTIYLFKFIIILLASSIVIAYAIFSILENKKY